ncbi:MAG: Veg family protein [Defluviitaleaceae bacterium]|nr:Veg family protein [Defluviitaleaceae bacterium]
MEKKNLSQIKQFVAQQVGRSVRVESNKRHNKSVVSEGVIANAYPSIFTIELSEEKHTHNRTVSYSYTDILTNSVELTLYDQQL